MFCPRCGAQSAENLKFCRNCGADLDVVSAALTGKLVLPNREKSKEHEEVSINDPDKLWSIFITNSLTGLAFIAIAIFLTVSNAIGGSVWGFWLLIPGAGSLGRGISSYFRAKRIERRREAYNSLAFASNNPPLFQNQSNSTFEPQNAKIADLYQPPPARHTGELVMPPSSVTEGTTRHLQMNTEGETINLPNQK